MVFAAASILAAVVTAGFVVFASQYWFRGIDRTLDIWPMLISLTYPDDGMPLALVEWDRIMFKTHSTAFYLHVVLSPLALACGLLQLSRRFHYRYPRLHRALGLVYLMSLAIGLPTGIWLGRFEYAGNVAAIGYFFMGTGTLFCTLIAVFALLRGDYADHRGWMIRSYSMLWFSSVGFRLVILFVLPSVSTRFGALPNSFFDPYVACIFIMPALGLVVADLFLAYRGRSLAMRT